MMAQSSISFPVNSVVSRDTISDEVGALLVESSTAPTVAQSENPAPAFQQVQRYSSGAFEVDSMSAELTSFDRVNADLPENLRQLVIPYQGVRETLRPIEQTDFGGGQIRLLIQTRIGGVFTHGDIAIKTCPWAAQLNGDHENYIRETHVYSVLPEHPNLVRLVGTRWDRTYFYLLTELVVGCDLQQLLSQHYEFTRTGLPVEQVRTLFRQMCLGVQAMHSVDICNLDVSLENSLVADQQLKLVDFGQAMPFQRDPHGRVLPFEAGRFQYYTKDYCIPPEMSMSQDVYGDKVDSFSLGTCLYTMLQGRRYSTHLASPCNLDYLNVILGRLAYHARRQCGCSQCESLQRQAERAGNVFGGASCRIDESAVQLITSLMVASPLQRASVSEALQSAFLNP